MKIIDSVSANLPTQYGKFTVHSYEFSDNSHHIALVKGTVSEKKDVLVRVHSECLTGDVFFSLRCDCGTQLERAFSLIEKEDEGIIILLHQEGRGIGFHNKIKAYALQDDGLDTVEANHKLGFKEDERTYETAALILTTLHVASIRLLTNNPQKVEGLSKEGIEVNERIPLIVAPTKENGKYIITKKEKMGHLFDEE